MSTVNRSTEQKTKKKLFWDYEFTCDKNAEILEQYQPQQDMLLFSLSSDGRRK